MSTMKKVNWELDLGHKRYSGTIEVDDDATDRDIDEEVRQMFFDSGMVQYNWEEVE